MMTITINLSGSVQRPFKQLEAIMNALLHVPGPL